jgi:hypothetical protein
VSSDVLKEESLKRETRHAIVDVVEEAIQEERKGGKKEHFVYKTESH